jgi:phage shock protein PspC (stress-responsive transcriptional regulator)
MDVSLYQVLVILATVIGVALLAGFGFILFIIVRLAFTFLNMPKGQ